jgi:hypothetical protein
MDLLTATKAMFAFLFLFGSSKYTNRYMSNFSGFICNMIDYLMESYIYNFDEFGDDVTENPEKIELIQLPIREKYENKYLEKFNNFNNFNSFTEEIQSNYDRLVNCILFETTPLGNVIMLYNHKKEVFEFYSDNTIPYRFLETVARKYVTTYNCKPLYIDMELELKECEQKILEKEEREKDEKRKLELQIEENRNNNIAFIEPKRNVYAKFKSYNKEGASGRVITAAPPKNSIPNREKETDSKILLKEKSNRYSYQGKMANFNILKKVDKKSISKKHALSFSEFKKGLIS